jgi:hypothetical protein
MLKGSCVPSHRASSAEVVYHGLRLPAGGWQRGRHNVQNAATSLQSSMRRACAMRESNRILLLSFERDAPAATLSCSASLRIICGFAPHPRSRSGPPFGRSPTLRVVVLLSFADLPTLPYVGARQNVAHPFAIVRPTWPGRFGSTRFCISSKRHPATLHVPWFRCGQPPLTWASVRPIQRDIW